MAKRWQNKTRPPRAAPPMTGSSSSPSTAGRFLSAWREWLPQASLIAALIAWIYWPALHGGLIWDDKWYVQMNPTLHGWPGLWKIWYRPGSWVEYYPLHETVLWLQWHLWGDDTLGYHLTNVGLHFLSALLVWSLLAKFGLRFAWLGGLIFAIHPVQVESVAYIVELKNTLSTPFLLLAMLAWIDYEETHRAGAYNNALGLYLLSMLCKISSAPFAGVILLYAWWKRGRIGGRDIIASLPFLALAVALSAVSLWAGRVYEHHLHTTFGTAPTAGLLARVDEAGLNLTVYFARCFLPVDVLYVYPQWTVHPWSPVEYLPWVVLAAVLLLLWSKRQTWGRHAILGLGFFGLMIFPFLGFTPVSYMAFIWVMDHLLYVPIIGLIGLVVAGVSDLAGKLPGATRPFLAGMVLLLIITMTGMSHGLAKLFVSEQTLWTHVLERNPSVWLAHNNLAGYLLEKEKYAEGVTEARAAIALRPEMPGPYPELGYGLEKLGRDNEAEKVYETAMKLAPGDPANYQSLANLKQRAGDAAETEALLTEGNQISPGDVGMGSQLAAIYEKSGRSAEAIAVYERVAEYNPDQPQVQYNLGVALMQAGNLVDAIDHLQTAVRLDPKLAAAHENLGSALAQSGQLAEAIPEFEAAVQLDGGYIIARNNLALALAQTGHIPEAVDQFQRVLQIDPNNARARDSLAKLQQFESGQAGSPGH